MGRLIYADELRSDMYEYVFPITTNNLMGAADAYYRILHLLDDAQTVDAAPVVHGEWIKHDYAEECEGFMIPNFECSQCHNWERKESDYCPNCGAKMDGGEEE